MLMLHSGAKKLQRQDLPALPVPDSTDTHTVIPHAKIVETTLEALAFRNIAVISEEYGVSKDGMKLFGVMTLSLEGNGVNLVLGLRNSHDKTFSLGMVAGFRVFVCDNLSFNGDFFAVSKKHSKKVMETFVETLSIGVDRVQRQFTPIQERINVWKNHELPDTAAREIIYRAFIEGRMEVPKHLARTVHDAYFEPTLDDFKPRTMWSLNNAFTHALKTLDPLPMYKATSSLGEYFATL